MLIACRECKEKVSTSARFCPHCGARYFAHPRWRRWLVYIVLLALVVVFFDQIVRYGYWGTKQVLAYIFTLWASSGP